MVGPKKVIDIIQNYMADEVEVVRKYETIDTLWGIDFIKLTDNDIKALKKGEYLYTNNGEYAQLITYESQARSGHWIQTNEFFINQDGQFIYKFICSECKSLSYFRKSNKKAIGANVCPNCGCRMIEPQERSNES